MKFSPKQYEGLKEFNIIAEKLGQTKLIRYGIVHYYLVGIGTYLAAKINVTGYIFCLFTWLIIISLLFSMVNQKARRYSGCIV